MDPMTIRIIGTLVALAFLVPIYYWFWQVMTKRFGLPARIILGVAYLAILAGQVVFIIDDRHDPIKRSANPQLLYPAGN